MSSPASERVAHLVGVIQHEAEVNLSVETYEPLLLKLLETIESSPDQREQVSAFLAALIEEWPWGAVEILEFTMRRLQWSEIRSALESSATQDPDFRKRRQAERVLEVFEDDWEAGEIYRLYRED